MGRTRGVGNGRSSPSFPVVLLVLALVSQAADMASAQWDSPSGRGPSYFNPQSFNPSMAVIIVVLVTAFFFLEKKNAKNKNRIPPPEEQAEEERSHTQYPSRPAALRPEAPPPADPIGRLEPPPADPR